MVHLWILQKAKGQHSFSASAVGHMCCMYMTLKSCLMVLLNSQGLKKPYNPIIGETFRCMWLHQKTNSKTFYMAEQVTTILLPRAA